MGLDVSHGCWHGAYSAFHRWRTELARVAGIDLLAMEGFEDLRDIYAGKERGPGMKWSALKPDVLLVLLSHSDCDGKIPWKKCEKLAARLEELLPLLPVKDCGGYTENWQAKTRVFIDGLRLAYSLKEDVRFY